MTGSNQAQPADETATESTRSAQLLRVLASRPLGMARLMEELHRRVHDEDSLIDLMYRASHEAVRLFDDVDWAGVTAQFAGPAFTAASTNRRVMIVDEGQYGQGDGPCPQAMRTDRPVSMTDEQVADRWPILAAAARDTGVRAFHAEPLHTRQRPVGCLNMYSATTEGLQDPDPDLLVVLTEYLDRGLTDYFAAQPGELDAHRLQVTLRIRFTINQAIGVLMATHGITADQASTSFHQRLVETPNVTAEQTALDIINDYTKSPAPPTPNAGEFEQDPPG
jgi:GAF domain-containing protein